MSCLFLLFLIFVMFYPFTLSLPYCASHPHVITKYVNQTHIQLYHFVVSIYPFIILS